MSAFIMTDAVYTAAQATLKKMPEQTLATYATVAAPFVGCKPSVFIDAYTARFAADKQATMLADVTKAVEAYKAPRGIVRLLSQLNGLSTELGKPCSLGLRLNENGEAYASVVVGKAPRKTKSNDGKTSSKSRISAFVACERGIKAGDSFKVEKWGALYKLTMPKGSIFDVKRGGLAQFMLDYYANNSEGAAVTNTNAVLVKYGYKLKD